MPIEVIRPRKEDVLACVARFNDLPNTDGGLPDAAVPGFHRTFYNVLGFQQPEGEETYSPIGDEAKPFITHLTPGFGLAYVAAKPTQGVMMHVHDTNETFVVMEGTWKMEWEGENGNEEILLDEKSARDGQEKGILLGVIGGDQPGAEYSPESIARLTEAGLWPAEAAE